MKSPSEIDYYIVNKNFMEIISISKDYLFVMAEDEAITEGAYKTININKKIFEKMKNLAIDNKRKELTDILKEVHNKNKEILENPHLQLRIEESRYDHNSEQLEQKKQSFIDHYKKSKAIVN
ncbi:hypothetical protein KAI04_00185 [Candidatus Pacearchaeota archaeon]|nr:hypothetical protein [Candidatus Pacearchaeota archaeon]